MPLAASRPIRARLPAPHLAPHRMPSLRLGRARHSTSRWASTRPRSRTCAACSTCAPGVPCPPTLSLTFPKHAACASLPLRAHTPGLAAPRPASHAPLSTLQRATAFNQPLSFNTSSVTDMLSMFFVRSARALALSLESGSPRACRLRRRRPTPSRFPAHTSPHTVCPAFDWAGGVGVQPAAELRHVQGQEHARHVRRALRACPVPPALSRALPVRAACVAATPRPRASRATPLPASHMPALRLGSKRTRSTSRSASTRPRSRTWSACSTCAPRVPWAPQPS